jgi:ribosomal protein L11 methyltransferase (prmA)
MSNQYFENNPNLKSNQVEMTYYIKGKTMHFLTDNGVFSKKRVDFGSSLLIKTLPEMGEKKILDVGCGYGPIGLTIAKMNPKSKVHMIDINERAIELAFKNKMLNAVENVEIFVSNIYENVHQNYDIIVTNPPIRAGKKVVWDITLGAIEYLDFQGEMWCVIQKKQGAESLLKGLKMTYTHVEVVEKENGYWIIKTSRK